MALLETIQLEHLPAGYTVHIALSRDIKNAAFLHQQLLTGNTSFEYALIDASIVSPFLDLPRVAALFIIPPQILYSSRAFRINPKLPQLLH
jgi:EKC/KEOPS complex subunit CGI121/TPRKB